MKEHNDFSLCLCGFVVKNARIRKMPCPTRLFFLWFFPQILPPHQRRKREKAMAAFAMAPVEIRSSPCLRTEKQSHSRGRPKPCYCGF
jgi:hypothetical protein